MFAGCILDDVDRIRFVLVIEPGRLYNLGWIGWYFVSDMRNEHSVDLPLGTRCSYFRVKHRY